MISLRIRSKKSSYQPFQRPSLLTRFRSKHRHFTAELCSIRSRRHRSSFRLFFTRCHRTYRSLCLTISWFLRLFIFLNRILRTVELFFEKIRRIFRLVHGWIVMIRSIFTALHLLLARLMNLSFKIYQIFYLLSILFEPFSKRTLEKAARSFSYFFYDYYSSNGGCYTLKARTHHIIKRVRARWKKSSFIIGDDEEEVFYDALNEEYQQ